MGCQWPPCLDVFTYASFSIFLGPHPHILWGHWSAVLDEDHPNDLIVVYYLKMLSPHSCILGSCGGGDDPMTSERAHFQSISLSQVISLSLRMVTLFRVCLECDATCLWPHKGQHGLCAYIYTCNELFIHRGRLREGNQPALISPETDNTRADPKVGQGLHRPQTVKPASGCSYSHGCLSSSASLLFRIPQEIVLS